MIVLYSVVNQFVMRVFARSETRNNLHSFLCLIFLLLLVASAKNSIAQQQIIRIDGTKITTDSLNNYLPELIRRANVAGLGDYNFQPEPHRL
ncbi:hypothetical protein ABIB30_002530 [Pedobacter sp. UYP1]